ncbi:MAG: 1-acyl-sn-glycerol-3-phosphate acyltransferase [Chitinophagaceae bacterium]|nr:1-acyl-sn-glycerol-3-phosphate acyltransferase [Chitinophagaceae bacterium]
MEKFFTGIYDYFKRRHIVLYAVFFVSLLAFAFFAWQVKFIEDISAIIPKDKKTEKLNQVFQNSKFADKLIVTVSLKDTTVVEPDSLIAYADSFVAQLQSSSSAFVKNIRYKVDDDVTMELFQVIQEHLPVFLSENDYHSIDTLIAKEKIKERLEQDIRILSSPSGLALKNIITNDPVGISFIALKKLQQLQYDNNFELYDNYIVTKDNKNLLLFITPVYPSNNTGKNIEFFHSLDSVINKLSASGFKDVDASYFGASAVSAGNAQQLRKDTLYTQGITVVFLVLFIALFFRKKRAPFLILIPVVYGALFSLAAVYFIKGSLSVIALATGSVILGIAINYSLHVFNHYRHVPDIKQVIKDLSFPLTIGSFTTIGGFFCLEFVKSEMLQDIGLFAGFSLIGASLCSLIFLPHFIETKKQNAHHSSWIDKIASLNPEHNKWLVGLIAVLTVVFFFFAGKVRFEPDMMQMNYMPADLKKAENKLNRITDYSLKSVYLVSEGKTLDEALQKSEKLLTDIALLKEKNEIKNYSGVSSLLLSDSLQRLRIDKWNKYWDESKKKELINGLQKEGSVLGFRASAFDNFKNLLDKNYEPADNNSLEEVKKNFLDDYITEKPGQASVITMLKTSAGSKQSVIEKFDDRADVTVLDRQYLTSRLTQIVNSDFNSIAWLTSILVFVVLLITFGRIELATVAFLPMLISWIWILGIMGIFGITFNLINIIVSALIFGLGDDYSLFIMDGLLQEYKTGKKNLSSYKSSIFLSAITTVAGLGVLLFAKHPALRSIAFVSVTGILCVVLMSQVLIPFLFSLLIKNRLKESYFPWTAWSWCKSTFSNLYFALGSLLLTPIGLVMIKLNPFNKEKGKYLFHKLVSKLCWSVMYIMPNVKKRIVNPLKEDFSKPAIIICNHQSSLDVLLTTMLSPKIILVVNKRVWSSPVFGPAVRMIDFYPLPEEGAEDSISLLAERVKKGYSIVIFPEGTRTSDGPVKRFHKGAFYIAEKLNLDILPIVLHGTGYTKSKGDLLLKDGTTTVQFLPRISPDDKSFGNNYSERTKGIVRYFRQQYEKIRSEQETPVYFKEQLIRNYLYKGPVLEWYMRVKIRLEDYYKKFDELLPKEGKLLDIGCGYGFMSYMLNFTGPQRQITALDYDEEKILTAQHCFSKNDRVSFLHADVLGFQFETYDGIVISDVLHYLQPDDQRTVINRCIESLQPNGILIIRDGDADLAERHKGTKLTEYFSTRFFGFNKTNEKGLSFLSGTFIKDIAIENGLAFYTIDNTKRTSNIIFVMKKAGTLQHAAV